MAGVLDRIRERGVVETIRSRVEEIRTRGMLPTVRSRVEEITENLRERVGGGGLTRGEGSKGGRRLEI